jgi:hypothetical protein
MNTKVNISAPTPWKVTSPKYSRVSGKAMKMPNKTKPGKAPKQTKLTQASLDKEMKVNNTFGAGLK